MPHVTFVQSNGAIATFDAAIGDTAMKIATDNEVAGIVAECGGSTACATCKVEAPEEWLARLPDKSLMEASLLEDEPPNVRLSCQIKMTADLDGIVLHVPSSQHR